jgi:hypothetical protein
MALGAKIQGLPWCATNQSNNKSVLPGNGKGITDESTTATANSPSDPRCVSQCGMRE